MTFGPSRCAPLNPSCLYCKQEKNPALFRSPRIKIDIREENIQFFLIKEAVEEYGKSQKLFSLTSKNKSSEEVSIVTINITVIGHILDDNR